MKKFYTKCLNCNNIIENYPSRIKKFCSYRCSSKTRVELRNKKCNSCDKTFKTTSPNQYLCGGFKDKNSCSFKGRKYRTLKRRYGISIIEYREILKKQSNKCAICKSPNKLVVDHSHKTKKVRGVLCRNCNTGVGMFNDNLELLKYAIKYLAPFAL